MKYFHYSVIILLTLFASSTYGQTSIFSVKIEGTNAGQYSLFQEGENLITTFSSLDIVINRLSDTLSFSQNIIYTENNDGILKSLDSWLIMTDTLSYEALFDENGIQIRTDSNDIYIQDSSLVLGPDGIRKLSISKLKNIGDTLHYTTFIPDLMKIASVNRLISGISIESGSKLWIVEEQVADWPATSNKFDQYFNLVETKGPSPFGEILISKAVPSDTIHPYFPDHLVRKKTIRSNLYFPDPTNINAVNLTLSLGDSISHLTLTDNSFNPVTTDSVELASYLHVNHWLPALDSTLLAGLFPIMLQSGSRNVKIAKLLKHLDTLNSPNQKKHLLLARMARALGFPSRIVNGFVYQSGFWVSHLWVEVGIGGEWKAFDPILQEKVSTALRIVLSHSSLQNGPAELFIPVNRSYDKLKIAVNGFLYDNKSIKLDQESNPSTEIRHGSYINHSLGLSFQIPKGFNPVTSDTSEPTTEFLLLESGANESISIEQIVSNNPTLPKQLINAISQFTSTNPKQVNKNKKLRILFVNNGNRAALAYTQGNSFIIFKIKSDRSSEILEYLLDKNLRFDF